MPKQPKPSENTAKLKPPAPVEMRCTRTVTHNGLRVVAGTVHPSTHPLVDRFPAFFEPVAAPRKVSDGD